MALPEGWGPYLATDDGLARAAVLEQHPGVAGALQAPGARETLLAWLGNERAWKEDRAALAAGILRFLRSGATGDDLPRAKPFLVHPDARVRRAAYDLVLSLYHPDRTPDAAVLLLTSMLTDEDETVRAGGAGYVEALGAAGELRDFLTRWMSLARSRGWDGTGSFHRVASLLEA